MEEKQKWIRPKNNGLKSMGNQNKSPSKVGEIRNFFGIFSFMPRLQYFDNLKEQTLPIAERVIFLNFQGTDEV